MSDLSKALKKYKKDNSLTQKQMAEAVDVGYRTYQDIEKTGLIKKHEAYTNIMKL